MIEFPPCISLNISFNDHAVLYQAVEKWVANNEDWLVWVSPEERERALAGNSVWTCQWYPDTPVGFYVLAASSFDALMAAVNANHMRRATQEIPPPDRNDK